MRESVDQQIKAAASESDKVNEVAESCGSCINELKDMVQLMEDVS